MRHDEVNQFKDRVKLSISVKITSIEDTKEITIFQQIQNFIANKMTYARRVNSPVNISTTNF